MRELFWRGLAAIGAPGGLQADWRHCCGAAYALVEPFLVQGGEMAHTHPCTAKAPCGCRHAVRDTRMGLKAVCVCGPGVCQSFAVRHEDLGTWEPDWNRLVAALGSALDIRTCRLLPASDASLWPVGTLAGQHVPVWFAPDARLPEPWKPIHYEIPGVLLVPAGHGQAGRLRTLGVRSGLVSLALDDFVTPLPDGRFHAECRLESLLEPFLAETRERASRDQALQMVRRELREMRRELAATPRREPVAIDEVEARRLFELVEKMEAGGPNRKAPALQVFRLYCLEGLSAAQVARRCRCSKALVVSRLGELRKIMGRDPARLRVVSPHVQRMEDSFADPRARKIRRIDAAGLGADDDDE